jgi:hypothetical protein
MSQPYRRNLHIHRKYRLFHEISYQPPYKEGQETEVAEPESTGWAEAGELKGEHELSRVDGIQTGMGG